jgi:hypothetical protein
LEGLSVGVRGSVDVSFVPAQPASPRMKAPSRRVRTTLKERFIRELKERTGLLASERCRLDSGGEEQCLKLFDQTWDQLLFRQRLHKIQIPIK